MAIAVLVGVLQRLAMELLPARGARPLTAQSCFDLPMAWMLAAVFVVIGRRARSMTAIPLDHPVFVDSAPAA